MKKASRISSFLAAAAFAAAAAVPSVPVMRTEAADVIRLEFEEGSTEGGKIYTDPSDEKMDLTGYSGKGYSYLDQKGTTVSVEADVPEEGLYELSICYCEPSDPNKKVQYLNINGVNQGEVTFLHNLGFEETSGGVVALKKGKNTIELKAYWGYCYYDYLTLKPADKSISDLKPTRTLSNPDASDSAKRLYSYLCDQYGNHILSGQQEYCGSHNYNIMNDPDKVYIKDNEEEFEYIKEVTGKQPAIRGIDYLVYNSDATWNDDAAERTIYWVKNLHGIATCTWHWNVPCNKDRKERAFYLEHTGNTPFTTFSISKALEEGTWENEVLMDDIRAIAEQLTKLKEADVPIIWRPLHEAEGGWFWWGGEGPENCKKLYRLLYDQLTNEYGLNNLIWEWTGYTSPASADWYPGDDVVDMIGYDKYNGTDGIPNQSSIASTFYSLVKGVNGEKMVAMSENDCIPSLENLVNDKAAWLYFCPWYKNYLTAEMYNPQDELKKIYTSEYCITLDELPDLYSYPITGEEQKPTEKATEKPTEKATEKPTAAVETMPVNKPPLLLKYGDANCDDKINVSDAVAVLQYVANKEKYPLSETGIINTDIDGAEGITGTDAIVIQKVDADLISASDLPLTPAK